MFFLHVMFFNITDLVTNCGGTVCLYFLKNFCGLMISLAILAEK